MSRSTSAIVASIAILGCIVAILPAQESSRRNASKYKPGTATESPERPNLSPPTSLREGEAPAEPQLPPIVPARPDASNSRSQFVPAGQALESTGSPAATAPLGAGLPTSPTSTDAAASDLDDTRLRSVLKRPQSAPAVETPARSASEGNPPSAPPSTAVSPPTAAPPELPRRTTTNNSATTHSPLTTRHSPAEPPGRSSARVPQSTSSTSKSAALKVEIAGPPGITVGKPAPYVVTVTNESDIAADEVHVRMPLPASVTVQSAQPTSGDAAVQGDARLLWQIPRVGPRSREQLKLQLVTREGDSFDLAAEWTCRPAVAKAAITIKQPQLALTLNGPAEMTFGEEKTFVLTASNPGTGDAERVIITVSAANAPPQQFDAGIIPAGHKKDVPLAVVASQAGTIELSIAAAAENGLEARTASKITVRKAEINVAVEGPSMKYAGSDATYSVVVTNTGTAAADNVNLSLALPAGAKYLSGIEGAAATATSVKWKIANLLANTERVFDVRLQLTTAGTNRVAVQSQAAASGAANAAAETLVEAVADLKLVVHDPSGPMPTGEPATYELQVMNRGTQAARQVKIVVQFSDGVEPVAYEGCDARIVPGQLLCHPLPQLGPGEQAIVKVKAKAEQPGSHHFRVEVTATDGDARLVSEGTTRFFADSGKNNPAASTARRPTLVPNTSVPTTLR